MPSRTPKRRIERALGKDAFDGDAHAFMVAVYKSQDIPLTLRLDAARSAAPYERPRLSTTQHSLGSIDLMQIRAGKDTLEEVRQLMREEEVRTKGTV